GDVTTIAGGAKGFADGAMAGAQFDHPQALAQAANGDVFLTDIDNFRIRRIRGMQNIDTVAGDGNDGYRDDDDRGASELHGLEGITVKPDGSMIYFADGTRGEDVPYNRVRQVKMP